VIRSRSFVLVAFLLVAGLLLPILFFPEPAMAENWGQVASGGMGPDFNQMQTGATSMAVYGSNLYVGTDNWNTGCEVWGYDGSTWSQANTDGFGNTNNRIATSMAVYGSNLYVGTYNWNTGCEVWEYDGSSWSQANTDGFGNPNNQNAPSMAVYNSNLYVGTENWNTGCEVWEYDGSNWSQVNTNGFGSTNNRIATSMAVYGSNLYVGTNNTNTGCEVWEYDGSSWSQANTDGFGNPNNQNAPSMAVYGSNLYVGTSNTNTGCEVWGYDGSSWSQVNTNGFGSTNNRIATSMAVYGSNLYVGTDNWNTGCEVWGYDGSTWSQANTDGFGDSGNQNAPSMAAYNSNLYVGTHNWNTGCEVWEYDGSNWSQVNPNGFALNNNGSVYSMAVYGSSLYIGTDNPATGCEVWEYDGSNWSQVNTDGFGNPDNRNAPSMAVYGSNLYVGTSNTNTGCEVWGYDGSNWSQVNTDGFGNSNNQDAHSMAVFGSNLYVGTYNWSTGCEVWGYDGSNWSQVNTDGFGDPNNQMATSMAVFGSNLYVGTNNWSTGCEVWGYDGSSWAQANTDGFGDSNNQMASSMAVYNTLLYVGTSNWNTGCEAWEYNGSFWTQANHDGFGVSGNQDAPSMAAYDSRLYVGTYNLSNGCEVWKTLRPATVSANPASGNQGTSLSVDIVGSDTGFANGVSYATFSGSGIVVNSTTVTDATHARADITISSDAPLGSRDVNVITAGEMPVPLSGGFTVEHPAPTVSGVTPGSGTRDGVAYITDLAGNNFRTGAHVRLKKQGQQDILGIGVTVASPTRITCIFQLAGAQAGNWDVFVENDDGKSGTRKNAFEVKDAGKKGTPNVDAVSPTSGPPGTAVTITGSDFGDTRGSSAVGFNGVPATEYSSWSDTRVVAVAPEGATTGKVVVITTNGESNKDVAFDFLYPTWYLAEGSSAWGYNTYLTIANPHREDLTAQVTYMTPDGPLERPPLTLPALSQTTVDPGDDLPFDTDFSTMVICREGKTIAVDRTMYWTGEGAPSPDGHSSIGVTSPAKTWYLPEGSSAWGFECFLLIQNPNDVDATCKVTYMPVGESPRVFEKVVPASSRRTYNMASDIGEKDAAIKVEGDIPVIPERAMYRNNKREGHDSIGATLPALNYYTTAVDDSTSSDCYMAEGTTAWGFTTYILIQNPNDTEAITTLTYMTDDWSLVQDPFIMPPQSRSTIRVNDILQDKDFSTHIHSDKAIIAERSMYWGEGTMLGEASHDTISMTQAHTTFYFPDGQTSDGRETYVLVGNPNDGNVEVEVTYLTPTGEGNVAFTEVIPAKSRTTFDMRDEIPDGRAAVVVTSRTEGGKIMAERAMYWSGRGAGTCTIGGCAD